ncbi:MAG: YfhO family protein, partial [Chloroflexota bacterium]
MALLLLLALSFLFFWRFLVGGQVLLPVDNLFSFLPWSAFASAIGIDYPHNELISDMVLQNLPWRDFVQESFLNGRLPLWNPYVVCGMPFLAGGQGGALYPLWTLLLPVPPPVAYGWFSFLHLFLGGAFLYFYMRVINVSRLGAVVSAVTFAFSGQLVVSLLWPMVVSTAIWLPLLLAIIESILKNVGRSERPFEFARIVPWLIAGAVVTAVMLLAGHLEYSFYVLFTAGAYSAFRLAVLLFRGRRLRPVAGPAILLLVMIGLGLGLAGLQLLPFAELSRENYRAGQVSYEDVVGWALPVRHLPAFLMPDFFGNPTHHSYLNVLDGRVEPVGALTDAAGSERHYPFWGVKNYVEGMAYVGVFPLILAVIGFIRLRRQQTWFFGIFAVFSLFLAFGSPLYWLFFHGIPGFDQLHSPFRWLFPYAFSVAVLAGIGAEALCPGGESEARRKTVTCFGAAVAATGGLILLVLLVSRLLGQGSLALAEALLDRSHSLAMAFSGPQMLYSYFFRNFLVLALLLVAGGLVVAYVSSRPRWTLACVAVVGIIVIDLFYFGYDFNSASNPELLRSTPPSVKRLKEDKSLYRVVSFGYEDVLPPVTAMLWDVQDIRGYDTMIPKRYVDFWSLMEEPHGLLYSKIHKLVERKSLESPLLDLMNVKYVLTTSTLDVAGFSRVYQGEIDIYRNEDVLPRAFAVFGEKRARGREQALAALSDPAFAPGKVVIIESAEALPYLAPSQESYLPAQVTSYEPDRVVVEVEMPREGYLVLSDTYFPGWRAQVDGQEKPVLRADHVFRAVRLQEGKHTVTFRYSPDSFKLGLYVSFLSFALLMLGLAYCGWRRFYRETEDMSTARRIVKNSLTPMATQLLNRLIDFGFAIFMLRLLGP